MHGVQALVHLEEGSVLGSEGAIFVRLGGREVI